MATPYEKLDPKSRELACEAAMRAAAEIINEVCGAEGARVVAITDKGAKLSFAVPAGVMDKVRGNPSITVEDLMAIPWSRSWSQAVLRMTHPEWEAYPEPKKQELMRGLIERKLLPTITA